MFVPGGPDEEGGSPRSRSGFKDSKRQMMLGGLRVLKKKNAAIESNTAKRDSAV